MIVEIFSDICKRVSSEVGYDVNYIFGDSTYIREAILTQKKIPQTATKRFPLIGLYTPFVEDKTDSKVYCKADVNIIIAVNTLKDYTNEQRIEVSFKGLLRPLYNALIKEVGAEKRFDFGYSGHVAHSYSENLVFGRRGAFDADGKEIEEKIDAIEITNLSLTVKKIKCYGNRL